MVMVNHHWWWWWFKTVASTQIKLAQAPPIHHLHVQGCLYLPLVAKWKAQMEVPLKIQACPSSARPPHIGCSGSVLLAPMLSLQAVASTPANQTLMKIAHLLNMVRWSATLNCMYGRTQAHYMCAAVSCSTPGMRTRIAAHSPTTNMCFFATATGQPWIPGLSGPMTRPEWAFAHGLATKATGSRPCPLGHSLQVVPGAAIVGGGASNPDLLMQEARHLWLAALESPLAVHMLLICKLCRKTGPGILFTYWNICQ